MRSDLGAREAVELFALAPVRAAPPMKELRFPLLVLVDVPSSGEGFWALDERREKRVLSQFLTLDSSFVGEVGEVLMGVGSSLLAAAAASRIRREDWSSIEVRIRVGETWPRGSVAGSGEAGVFSSLVVVASSVVVATGVASVVGEVASAFKDLRFSFARRFSSSRAAFSSASLAFFSSLSCSVGRQSNSR